jgi:hypothetical protein
MSWIDLLCIGGGLAVFAGIFTAGFFGERARIQELDGALGGAL